MPDKEPDHGDYRAVSETNTITGDTRWCIEMYDAYPKSSARWKPTPHLSFSTREDAEGVIVQLQIDEAWVRDA